VTVARVLVDLLFYTGSKGGMESYVERLYSAFPRNTGLEFTGLVSREAEKLDLSWFPGETVPSGVPGENRVRWAAGELLAVPRAARTAGAHLIHSPANVGPARSRVPLVLTVHDLLPFVHPEWVPGRRSAAIRWLIRRASRAASRVITVSEASGADIRTVLAVRSERIDVIPLAGRPAGTPAIPVGTVPAEEPPLVLLIGNRMPHKNGETLLRALAALPADSRPRLAVTGGSTSGDPLRALAEELGIPSWRRCPAGGRCSAPTFRCSARWRRMRRSTSPPTIRPHGHEGCARSWTTPPHAPRSRRAASGGPPASRGRRRRSAQPRCFTGF